MKVRGRSDMLLGPPGREQPEESATFQEDVVSIARAGIKKEMAFYIARVNGYREANKVSFDEALRAVGGQLAENPDPNERMWLQIFGEKVEEVGVRMAASSATDAVYMAAYHPEAGSEDKQVSFRGEDWRTTVHKTPALHLAHVLYSHPDLRVMMDRIIGVNREPTMNDVKEIFDKLKENSYYREFLLRIRNEMAKIYGTPLHALMDDAPPTSTAMVPRTMRSGSSGGGITHRPRATGGSTYL